MTTANSVDTYCKKMMRRCCFLSLSLLSCRFCVALLYFLLLYLLLTLDLDCVIMMVLLIKDRVGITKKKRYACYDTLVFESE